MPSTTRANGVMAMVIATLLWAVGSVLTKQLLQKFRAIDLIAIELGASNVSLWATVAFTRTERPRMLTSLRLALPGLLQPGLAYSLSFVGLQWTTVSLETLIWSSEGAIMLPFAISFLGERASRTTVVLGMLSIVGVIVASLDSVVGARAGSRAIVGDLLILGAVVAACAYTVFAQKELNNHDPLLLVTLHQLAGLILVSTIRAYWTDSATEVAPVQSITAYGEAALAGCSQFSAPFWLFLVSIQRLGSATASQFLPLVPILTVLLARLVLGEAIEPMQTIGGAITISAAVGLSWAAARLDSK